jgi:hypothetical protein
MKTAGYGKDAPWKSPLDFPTSLGNPAKAAGSPLSAQPLPLLLTKNMTTTDRVTFPFEATRPERVVDVDQGREIFASVLTTTVVRIYHEGFRLAPGQDADIGIRPLSPPHAKLGFVRGRTR